MSTSISFPKVFNAREKEQIIKDYVENYLSLRELYKKYNIKSKQWIGKLLSGKTRDKSDAAKLSHKKYADKFKHTDESKEKIRKAHLKWMMEHPEKTAWRQSNMSYPEKCFKKILEDNNIDKKYLIYREYSVFPYFIDFAFVDEKLAVEIDGSQHLEEDRKSRDKKKDETLIKNGWRVLRIAATEVTHDGTKALESLMEMLNCSSKTYNKVGILIPPKKSKYVKLKRCDDGLTDGERLRAFNQRKVERPSKEELSRLLKESNFTAIGKTYGVSDNAIRRWCKTYGLPHRRKDMQVS